MSNHFDESQHPRRADGKFGHGTVRTRPSSDEPRSLFGSYGRLSDEHIDLTRVDLDDPNSVGQISRAHQQESFLRFTALNGWVPQEITDADREFIESLRDPERRQARIALRARESILAKRGTGRGPVTQGEADEEWYEATLEQLRLDEAARRLAPEDDSNYDMDLVGG